MITIKRKNNDDIVKVFAQTFEPEAYEQIKKLANYEAYENCCIRIMPDAHAGKGCTVGTTIQLNDKVTPNLVGVDIGCGMLCVPLSNVNPSESEFKKLDEVIRKYVPSGFNIHPYTSKYFNVCLLNCWKQIDISRVGASLGTLGGGNHFIEIDYSEKTQSCYLVIHTGSRNLGVQICKYYQGLAIDSRNTMNGAKNTLIKKLKAEGRQKDIQLEIQKLQKPPCDKDLAHLEGELMENYLHDMYVTQDYASYNRKIIAETIMKYMGWRENTKIGKFETIHNYIDKDKILRKGAVSAKQGEKLIIPMNMRDGSLICVGKGNGDWNYSAPHGAGRLMSRSKAKELIDMNEYEESMKNIYTTSVNQSTIDEAPQVYKDMNEIIECIEPTVDIVDIIKPLYNFKAGEETRLWEI